MSFLIASPEALLAAASDLAGIGSTIQMANAAAAAPRRPGRLRGGCRQGG